MNIPFELWGKLDFFYSLVATPNMIFLKDTLFNYKMDIFKSMYDNIDEFTKMTLLMRGID